MRLQLVMFCYICVFLLLNVSVSLAKNYPKYLDINITEAEDSVINKFVNSYEKNSCLNRIKISAGYVRECYAKKKAKSGHRGATYLFVNSKLMAIRLDEGMVSEYEKKNSHPYELAALQEKYGLQRTCSNCPSYINKSGTVSIDVKPERVDPRRKSRGWKAEYVIELATNLETARKIQAAYHSALKSHKRRSRTDKIKNDF